MTRLNLTQPVTCPALYQSSLPGKGKFTYLMEDRWAFHLYFAKGSVRIGENKGLLEEGTITITPPGLESVYQVTEELPYIYGHFMTWQGPYSHTIPHIIPPGYETEDLIKKTRRASSLFSRNPLHSRAILWEILFSISREFGGEKVKNEHPALKKVKNILDNELFTPLTLEEIGERVHLSTTHLNRLFKSRYGTTVYHYIMEQRMKQVKYLITQTPLSLKQIALESGYNNLQSFNKQCRQYLGDSPRGLRDNKQPSRKMQ